MQVSAEIKAKAIESFYRKRRMANTIVVQNEQEPREERGDQEDWTKKLALTTQ